jgi:hypothetical protein
VSVREREPGNPWNLGRCHCAGTTGVGDHPTIAIRARAQVPRKELQAIVNGAIDVMLAVK